MEADRYAAERRSTAQKQLGRLQPPDELPAAMIAAHQGRVEGARAPERRQRSLGPRSRAPWSAIGPRLGVGFIELSLGDATRRSLTCRRAYELANTSCSTRLSASSEGDLLEALIAAASWTRPNEILATWHAATRPPSTGPGHSRSSRGCRGLLLATQEISTGALVSFERALAEHDRSDVPFQHARTLLALGRTQRRAKQRGDARATLEDALDGFERLGAPLWAEQTRAELTRIGGRAPANGELTEAERRIAMLVAGGRTNREVAAALFLTVHSVETTLTRVYRKLEVRSRTELAHVFAANS